VFSWLVNGVVARYVLGFYGVARAEIHSFAVAAAHQAAWSRPMERINGPVQQGDQGSVLH
jgi:hypothetical protein